VRAASLFPISPLSPAPLSSLSAQELAEILREPPRVVPPIGAFSPFFVALVSFPYPPALSSSFPSANWGSPEEFIAVGHGAALSGPSPAAQGPGLDSPSPPHSPGVLTPFLDTHPGSVESGSARKGNSNWYAGELPMRVVTDEKTAECG